jgi:hypothetical protein
VGGGEGHGVVDSVQNEQLGVLCEVFNVAGVLLRQLVPILVLWGLNLLRLHLGEEIGVLETEGGLFGE